MAGPTAPKIEQATTPRPESLIGVTLDGRYAIETELGRGGIGVVYLARDRKLMDKRVVVKVLLEQSVRHEWVVRKFTHEREALSRVDHPGIVGILDAGETPGGAPYIVTQCVDGLTLRAVICPEGIDIERAAALIEGIAHALEAVHDCGIMHRDLKPENIMIQALTGGREQVRIIDFGIAKIRDSRLAPSTVGPATAGTIAYMAPEQLRGEKVTPAADIYSLGVIAYEMVTGRRPFNPETVFQLLEMQREGVRVRPSDLRPALPRRADRVILRALAFDPQGRYQSALEFGDELSRALGAGPEVRELSAEQRPAQADPVHADLPGTRPPLPATLPATPVVGAAPIAVPPQEFSGVRNQHSEEPQSGRWRWLAPLIGCIVLLSLGAAGGTIWYLVKHSQSTVVQPGAGNTAATRTLTYWLTVQKMRDGKPYKEPFESSGQEVFENGYKFRFNVTSPDAGYLYLLNEGANDKGENSITWLYPTPARNNGSAEAAANQTIETGWNTFGGQAGTEQFWMVWALKPVAELESAKDTAFKNKGELRDAAQAKAVREFLAAHRAQNVEITGDKAKSLTVIKGAGDVLVKQLELVHR